ncbi:metallophosphoesterase [Maribacter sp. 2307ULW6-5]|uniref:metallophosphoesterase n=1 Tax=Maribacter sp. 2307ULW6-5 TaxID=3386275 RepID=UPI0039BD5B98
MSSDVRLAVLADIHLQDVYGELQDTKYRGVLNPANDQYALIRTMGSQLRSTRIFNENYFAFLAALDDIVARDIKYVIVPGDFSDDGQPLHLRGFKDILSHYSKKHSLSFFLATGNHDVIQPFARNDGKADFLGKGGKKQPIFSEADIHVSDSGHEHPVVISKDLKNLGYRGIVEILGDHGFYPKPEHNYWSSPFAPYGYGDYDFKKASESASLTDRAISMAPDDLPIPDLSYLVEPMEGLWLLSLDANTYIEREKNGPQVDPALLDYPNNGLGLDNLLTHKRYLLDWVAKVVKEAKAHGKTLIAFSHYPMVDFTNGAAPDIGKLLQGGRMQNKRVPKKEVADLFSSLGLKLHFGGHMHLNDTGIHTTEGSQILVNVQVPSLAAYAAAYKVVTVKGNDVFKIETVLLDTVPRFNEFFGLYEQEHDFLEKNGQNALWDKAILSSETYGQFMNAHLKELVRLRFLPSEWPKSFVSLFQRATGKELLALSKTEDINDYKNILNGLGTKGTHNPRVGSSTGKVLEAHKMNLETFGDWTGEELIFDLYRLRNGDGLSHRDIGGERLEEYKFLANSFLAGEQTYQADLFMDQVRWFMTILEKFVNDAPSNDFEIDFNTGKLQSLRNQPRP